MYFCWFILLKVSADKLIREMVDYGYFSEFLLEKEEGELEEEKEVIIKDKFKGKKVRDIRFRENYIFLFIIFFKNI